MKKIILVHGWDGSPNNCWFPWLKKELMKNGFEVAVPSMPNPDEPNIKSWVWHLKKITGKVDEETYFVGHSIGCQAIMRYLETLPKNSHIGGIVFVAGFFNLNHLETGKEKKIAKPWIETPIDADKIKMLSKNIVAIFSNNDPFVPVSDSELFKERFNAKIIIENDKGHFSDDDGIKELPAALKEILKMK